jgi:hypothetical protein
MAIPAAVEPAEAVGLWEPVREGAVRRSAQQFPAEPGARVANRQAVQANSGPGTTLAVGSNLKVASAILAEGSM